MMQTNDSTLSSSLPSSGGKKATIIIGIILALLAAAYLGLCAYAGSLDTFYPHYHMNGVDVSGLSVEDAQEKLVQTLMAQEISLQDAETREQLCTISLAELGYTAQSLDGSARYWMENRQQEGFLTRGWTYLMFLTGQYNGGWYWPDPDAAVLSSTADTLAQQLSRAPQDASFKILDAAVEFTTAMEGRKLDPAALQSALAEIDSYSQNGYQISIPFTVLDAKTLSAQEVYTQLSGEVCNASYDAATDTILPESIGVTFDPSAAQTPLDAAEPGTTVSVPAEIQFPEVTAEELKSLLFRDVLGEARTKVTGTSGRRMNVRLSSEAINDLVLNSGEVFSYNESVGQRTAENGYYPAPAYVKGETVDEIGGGICQTSSTLYLACLLGNLEITERYAHRYVPAYIDWGMDATVSWGGPDYKFTNNTLYPIRIVTEFEDGKNDYVTVRILGTNVDGSYAKMSNEVLSSTPWETVYEEDPTLAPGVEQEKTSPYTGYLVKAYQTIYDKDGNVLDRHLENTSDYKVRNKVILRGPTVPAANPEELPTETPVTPELPVEPDVPVDLPVELPEEPADEISEAPAFSE